MRPRDILAANLRALMATHPDLDTLPKITARSGVTNGTLDRIRRAVVSTRVDELEKLGRAFGIEPWELLRPHGHTAPSPLGLMLATHLDRAAADEKAHTAAFAAAIAVIDALTSRSNQGTAEPEPAAEPLPQPARAKEKRPA
jgi:transcriptional regulator with XRE-family HTH domain